MVSGRRKSIVQTRVDDYFPNPSSSCKNSSNDGGGGGGDCKILRAVTATVNAAIFTTVAIGGGATALAPVVCSWLCYREEVPLLPSVCTDK